MQSSERSFTIEREEDYVQSANTLFHFMKREQWLKDALSRRAIIPRYCVENIEYLGISDGKTSFEEAAILQKCFCDIPFHKLMQTFSLCGEGEEFERLEEDDKFKAANNNTHPDFYGEYAIAFSKKWGESHDLQPIHYLNKESSHTRDFTKTFEMVLGEEEISDTYVDDILNRLAYIKPLRGIMNRQFTTKDGKEVTIQFWKNFHDEKEWRFVPNAECLQAVGIEKVIANPNVIKHTDALNKTNESIESEEWRQLWLEYKYDEIRYILVPNANARINIIRFILSLPDEQFSVPEQADLEKQILVSKILVLDEIRKDW